MSAFQVWNVCCDIVGQQLEFDTEATIFDLDMNEERISELIVRLELSFGKGAITFEDLIACPSFSAIASRLPAPPPPTPPPPPPPAEPPITTAAADRVLPAGLVRSTSHDITGLAPLHISASTPAGVRPSLSYNENLGVGIVGGCVETAALMPVLTWKFCVQEGRPLPPFPSWTWYRGVAVLAGSVAPLTGIQMSVNGVFEGLLTRGERNLTDVEVVGCALGAGAVSAALYGPVELTTIHQQKTGLGPLGTITHLARTHGITSLWRGLVPTACREAIYTAGCT